MPFLRKFATSDRLLLAYHSKRELYQLIMYVLTHHLRLKSDSNRTNAMYSASWCVKVGVSSQSAIQEYFFNFSKTKI